MISLLGLNRRQQIIADTLWYHCHSQQDVDAVIRACGADAETVYHLIVAEALDRCLHTDLAQLVTDRFRSGSDH